MTKIKVTGGPSLAGVVFIVFLILKLTHVIGWSWWWVTAPLWISAGLSLIALAVMGTLLLFVAAVVKECKK